MNAFPTRFRAAICDSQTLLRPYLERLLVEEGSIEILWSVGSLDEVSLLRDEQVPELLLINFTNPQPRFLEQVHRFAAAYPTVRIVAMSDHPEDECVLFPDAACPDPRRTCCLLRAYEMGAAGFVRKTATPSEFVQAVRDVAEGRVGIDAPTLAALRARADVEPVRPRLAKPPTL